MKRLLIFAVFLLVSVNVGHARQQACMSIPREVLVETLRGTHKEQTVGVGIGNQGRYIVELFASKTGSFTLIIAFPDGSACMLAGGTQWQTVKPDIAMFDLPS